MKALMVNSTSGNIVSQKMRDEMYMKHLRQVEKINNRQAEQITKDLKTYRSINDLHHKHRQYAFQWHHKEENQIITQKNTKVKQKIAQIRSFFQFKVNKKEENQHPKTSTIQKQTPPPQLKNPELSITQKNNLNDEKHLHNEYFENLLKQRSREKRKQSLHYRYRKKRQEEIDHENQKLIKAIQSQRSNYLPRIYRNRHNKSVNTRNQEEDISLDKSNEIK